MSKPPEGLTVGEYKDTLDKASRAAKAALACLPAEESKNNEDVSPEQWKCITEAWAEIMLTRGRVPMTGEPC